MALLFFIPEVQALKISTRIRIEGFKHAHNRSQVLRASVVRLFAAVFFFFFFFLYPDCYCMVPAYARNYASCSGRSVEIGYTTHNSGWMDGYAGAIRCGPSALATTEPLRTLAL